MNKKDMALLMLAEAHGKPFTPVQIQKALFLLQNAFDNEIQDGYNFKPYSYGPFDAQVYRDAESLSDDGMVNIISPDGQNWDSYSCTIEGYFQAQEISKSGNVSQEFLDYVKDVVEWILPLSFSEIVSTIYTEFPEMRENSIFSE